NRNPQAAGRRRQPAHRGGGGIMRYFLAIFALSVIAVVGILGFRGSHSRRPPLFIFPDMEWQFKLPPQKPNCFFPNGRSSQVPRCGTVGGATPIQTSAGPVFPYEDAPVNTGFVTGTTNFVEINPLPITAGLLARGQQRFTINCSPCHGQLADGNGITKKINAMPTVANLHDKRIAQMTDRELFYVTSNCL